MKKALLFLSKHILTAFFVVVVLLAFFRGFIKDQETLDENRRMAEFPSELNLEFPKKFEDYYMDNFPNRKKLVRRYNKTRFKKFGINNYLLFGDDDFLFFNSKTKEETDSVADYLGLNLYSEKLLKDNIDHLENQIKKMEALGADVFVMIAPNKSAVYPELMPGEYKNKNTSFSKSEQIIKALKERGIKVVEVKDAIVKAKDKHLTYLKRDTHWNRIGAFAAYKEMEKALKASKKMRGVKSFQIKKTAPIDYDCGDLQRYLFGVDQCRDDNYDVTYNYPLTAKCENTGKGSMELNAEVKICFSKNKNGKKMVMLRDSFAEALVPLLSEQFEKSVYLWRGFLSDEEIVEVVEREKPDVIVIEYLERFVGLIADKIFD